jgi:hypothetical protein
MGKGRDSLLVRRNNPYFPEDLSTSINVLVSSLLSTWVMPQDIISALKNPNYWDDFFGGKPMHVQEIGGNHPSIHPSVRPTIYHYQFYEVVNNITKAAWVV